MIKSFPFAGIFTGYDENGFPRSDRDYSEEDLARYVSDIFSDGVLEHGNNALMVTSNGGMSVRINYGAINIRGRHGYIYEEPEYLTLDPGDDLPRIDLVAMRLDTSIEVRAITPVVIRGTPSADPVMPVLTRNNIIYDMVLASVYIPDDVYSITQDDITDIRKDEDLCGTVYRIGKTRRNIGDIFIQSYPSANPNDLLCDGRYYDPTVYPDLHAKLSTLGLYNPNQWIMNQITPEFAGSSINGVCWSPQLGIFVAVGGVGSGSTSTGYTNYALFYTSPDGITWSLRNVIALGGSGVVPNIQSVAWSPQLNLFAAVGGGAYGVYYTSPDGVNWTGGTITTSKVIYDIAWSPEQNLFAVTGINSSNVGVVYTTPNGTTWTLAKTFSAQEYYQSIAWSPALNKWALAGRFSSNVVGVIATTSDFATWNSPLNLNSGTSISYMYAVTWSPELHLFVAAGMSQVVNQGTLFYSSSDGSTWTQRLNTGQTARDIINRIAWSPTLNLFVAVGIDLTTGTSIIYTSSDGINWTLSNTTIGVATLLGVTWSPDRRLFVLVGENPFGRFYSMTDKPILPSYNEIMQYTYIKAKEDI